MSSSFLASTPLSSSLISLSWWISFLMMLASHNSIFLKQKMQQNFSMMITTLNMVLMLTFSSLSMLWFYIFFEVSLIPTLFLILGWGNQPERLQAGMYMIIYTITASLPLLMLIFFKNISMNKMITTFNQHSPQDPWSYNMFIFFSILAFMVKLPVYSVHLWLPKAHVEAPVAGSMILAGILLKLGGFGLIQASMFFKMFSSFMSTSLLSLSLWGALLTSMICIRQTDLKSLIAYSSVAHMSFVLASVLSFTSWGWTAAFTMMISHGLCSSALFCLSNMLYEKMNSRSMLIPKGLITIIPSYSLWWFMFCASNIPTPPSITMMSEIISIPSIINFSPIFIILIALMGMFSATYNLFLYSSSQHGTPSKTMTPFLLPYKIQHKIFLLHISPMILLIISMPKISM
uniref:NADH-ubiquinone oxidoreductase chain 4 n=1 Tax=Pectinodonta sp. TaxID=3071117 RepID=A0AA96HRM0_9GAST|nr:NADH dehydrogenase subunit 4 [Pectinodonta sp.]